MGTDVPSCSNDLGNTITKSYTVNPAIRWCFTLNNYSEGHLDLLRSIVPQYCKKYIIAKEVGAEGTPHLQGYVEFKKKVRPLSVLSIKEIHWEKAKGNIAENSNYCSKEGSVWLVNGMPRPKKSLPLMDREWQQDLINIVRQEPDDRIIFWYYSNSGNTGKTTFARYLHREFNAVLLSGKASDMKNCIVEFEKSNGYVPECVVIDLPRGFDKEYLSYNGLEEIKNMFFFSGKYEGGMVDGNPPHLIIFCNEKPNVDKMSKDRWRIVDIEGKVFHKNF